MCAWYLRNNVTQTDVQTHNISCTMNINASSLQVFDKHKIGMIFNLKYHAMVSRKKGSHKEQNANSQL